VGRGNPAPFFLELWHMEKNYDVIAWYNENSQRVIARGLRDIACAINYADDEFARNRGAIVSVITPNGFTKYEISEFGVQYM
jgi:hypothetical protein